MGAAAATKTTPAALGGPEGGRLRTSAGRSLRWEALAGAPPVLRCELGHKESSALAPQDRGPEVSRRPILTALPSQASLSARWEQPTSPSLGSRAGCRGGKHCLKCPSFVGRRTSPARSCQMKPGLRPGWGIGEEVGRFAMESSAHGSLAVMI